MSRTLLLRRVREEPLTDVCARGGHAIVEHVHPKGITALSHSCRCGKVVQLVERFRREPAVA